MKKKAIIITSSALIVAAGAGITAYNVLNNQDGIETTYSTEVKKGDIQVSITANGVVTPTTVKNIVPAKNGTIKQNFLEDGKFVKKGDLLVAFEGEDVSQDLSSQEGSLEKLNIDLMTLQKQLEKYQKDLNIYSRYNGTIEEVLVKRGDSVKDGQTVAKINVNGDIKNIESKVSGEVQQINIEKGRLLSEGALILSMSSNGELENQIKKQKIDIESAKESIASLKEKGKIPDAIYAPYDGEIKVSNEAAVGSEINLNSVLGTITNYSQFNLVLSIDELDVPKLKVGQLVTISAEAYPGETFTGKVAQIASQGEITNGVSTFKVEVSIDDPKDLKAGMTANAKIVVSENKNALLVPVEAVTESGNNKYVTILDGEEKKKVKVATGLNNENNIEIKNGLKEGQKVVLPTTSVKSDKSVLSAVKVGRGND